MKGKVALCTIVLLAALIVVGVAYACVPQEPVCPAGQITVTPAAWVEGTETCPTREFSASRTVIDVAAHTEHRHKSGGNWGSWQDGHCSGGGQCEERTIPAVTHVETFGPITVQYGLRSQDPNHCHRPNGQNLGVPSWAMDDYNDDLPEHLDKIVTLGYWIDPVCRAPVVRHEQLAGANCSLWEITEETWVEDVFTGYPVTIATAAWADPNVLETATPSGVDAEGDAWSFTINEPDCYEACDVTVAQTPTIDWGNGWSPWVYNPTSGLEESYRDGIETTVYLDSRDAQLVCDTATLPVHEERTREVDYPNGALVQSQTCEPAPGSWVYEVIVPEGASAELISGALSGPWLNLYAPEDNAASVPTAVFTWDSGYSEQVVGEVIDKHLECLHCRVTELYSMTLYTDPNAPAVYWEGPFGFPACPIIHLDGEVPAAFRVTQNCSICPQSGLEGGYIFHGVPVADGEGRVLRYDCYGHEPRYFYLEQDWDDLVRFDFDADGTRRSCRVDGCVDWINENAGLTP